MTQAERQTFLIQKLLDEQPQYYVIHTVGPIVQGGLTQRPCELLSSCCRSCLELADKRGTLFGFYQKISYPRICIPAAPILLSRI